MKNLIIFLLLMISLGWTQANVGNMVCFYDSASFLREGPAQLSINELEPALNFCNYLIYGYAGIDVETKQLKPLNVNLDINREHYRAITGLKRKYPQLRILLSVGGDKDVDPNEDDKDIYDSEHNKYLTILEEAAHRQAFISSIPNILKTYGFDGIDLSWQFTKNRPKVLKKGLKKAWNAFKGWFTGAKVVDEKAEEHKAQFTLLVQELKRTLQRDASILTLTMLPHVDASLFIDIPMVLPSIDFVNLGTYDFQTPARDPKVADHAAPLYELYERNEMNNVNYQVNYWLNNTANAQKIHIGIATYGNAWIMSRESGITGYPPIPEAEGPAPMGRQTQSNGLRSWPEICDMLHGKKDLTGDMATLRKVGDPTKRYGIYAYRAADENGEYGVWVSYEDPTTAAIKAGYVQAKALGGVALHDLSFDDFRGQCAGEKFPILRSIKYKL